MSPDLLALDSLCEKTDLHHFVNQTLRTRLNDFLETASSDLLLPTNREYAQFNFFSMKHSLLDYSAYQSGRGLLRVKLREHALISALRIKLVLLIYSLLLTHMSHFIINVRFIIFEYHNIRQLVIRCNK